MDEVLPRPEIVYEFVSVKVCSVSQVFKGVGVGFGKVGGRGTGLEGSKFCHSLIFYMSMYPGQFDP